MKRLQSTTISFRLRGEPKEFTVIHNLKSLGLSIGNAAHSWAARTTTGTAEDFVKYCKRKEPNTVMEIVTK